MVPVTNAREPPNSHDAEPATRPLSFAAEDEDAPAPDEDAEDAEDQGEPDEPV